MATAATADPVTPGPAPDAAASSGTVVLERRRIFILPTAHGLTFALALGVMLAGSINYNNGLGHVLTFLLGSLALVSTLHTHRNLSGLRLRAGDAEPVHAGGTARLALHVDNRGGAARHALLVRFPDGSGSDAVTGFSLHAGEIRRVELPVAAPSRGRMHLERVTIATRYPFGLFRAWSPLPLAPECLVYPRPAGTRTLPDAGAERGRDGGLRGAGREDFAGFRDYAPGDSPRLIHWKAVAREQGVPVKVFAGAAASELDLRYEDAPGSDVEARLSQLALWVLEAESGGHRYALSLPGESIPAGTGHGHLHACLEALALFGGGVGR